MTRSSIESARLAGPLSDANYQTNVWSVTARGLHGFIAALTEFSNKKREHAATCSRNGLSKSGLTEEIRSSRRPQYPVKAENDL